jgi:hypothetical protein
MHQVDRSTPSKRVVKWLISNSTHPGKVPESCRNAHRFTHPRGLFASLKVKNAKADTSRHMWIAVCGARRD